MIIIGEKINSSIPSAFEAMKSGDDAILSLIKAQESAGANYLDVNTAMFGDAELDMMKKVIRLILDNSSCGIMIDSPNPSVLADASLICRGRDLILNSVTTDERIDELAPIAADLGCGIVALPMNKSEGIPDSAEGRLKCAIQAIDKLVSSGVSEDNIYIDAICETIATCDTNAKTAIDTINLIKTKTKAKTVCGLSNVSFGLPKRVFLNSAFLSVAIFSGLDAAIIDPCIMEIRKALYSANVIAGLDEYCMEYINFIREVYM
jgi:5-methyltetrahydrofolate corrinoid/iron sulfur protein methyltransferase